MGNYRQTTFLFCFCCLLFSGLLTGETFESYLDVKLLQEKAKNPPNWMLEKIRRDLEPYQHMKLTPELIEKARLEHPNRFHRLIVRPNERTVKFAENEREPPKSWKSKHKKFFVSVVSFLVDQGLITYDLDLLMHTGHASIASFTPSGDHPPIFRRHMPPNDDPENQLTILFPNTWELSRNINQGFKTWKKVLKEGFGVAWEDKKSILFWRGGIRRYGSRYYPGSSSELSAALYRLADHPRSKLVKLSEVHQSINAHYVNMHVEDEIPGYKKAVESTYREGTFVPPQDQLEYKYLISVDGHANPSALAWQLLSNSVCLKQEPCYRQFFSVLLKPYVHYIPLKPDMSDLLEKFDWLKNHDTLAREVAENATKFALTHLTPEHLFLYLATLINEYGKMQSGL